MKQKKFVVDGKEYSFFYLPDTTDPNPASVMTFTDEEEVRLAMYYPYIKKVVYDIGAGFGSYMLPALAMGALVYGWSPEHEYKLLGRSLALKENNFRGKYHLYDWGFYSENGIFKTDEAKFYPKVSGQNIIDANKPKTPGWYIPVQTLDGFCTGPIFYPEYIKIDAEGAELEILKGGIETIKEHKPLIQVEHHVFKDPKLEENVYSFLKELGYHREHFMKTGSVTHGLYVPSSPNS